MPETNIGFLPDVGSTYYLSHFPGAIGMYLALTSDRMLAADCIYTGFATHVIDSTCITEILVLLDRSLACLMS
jgi:enoyl-CoA hydratase